MKPSHLNASNATCRVYTFKEGLLSSIGHDLLLAFGAFTVTRREDESVAATFDLRSLRVQGMVHAGTTTPLSPADHGRIDASTQKDVLAVDRYPSATVEGKGDAESFRGTLTLHGVTRPITATLSQSHGACSVVATLTPSQFGIKPFRAMLGTLRVEDRVRIEIAWKEDVG